MIPYINFSKATSISSNKFTKPMETLKLTAPFFKNGNDHFFEKNWIELKINPLFIIWKSLMSIICTRCSFINIKRWHVRAIFDLATLVSSNDGDYRVSWVRQSGKQKGSNSSQRVFTCEMRACRSRPLWSRSYNSLNCVVWMTGCQVYSVNEENYGLCNNLEFSGVVHILAFVFYRFFFSIIYNDVWE